MLIQAGHVAMLFIGHNQDVKMRQYHRGRLAVSMCIRLQSRVGSNDHIEFLVYTLVGKHEIRSLNRLTGLQINTGVPVIALKASSGDIGPGAIATRCYVESRASAYPCPALKRVIYATGTRISSTRLRIQLARKYLNVHQEPPTRKLQHATPHIRNCIYFLLFALPSHRPAEKQSPEHPKWFASQLLS